MTKQLVKPKQFFSFVLNETAKYYKIIKYDYNENGDKGIAEEIYRVPKQGYLKHRKINNKYLINCYFTLLAKNLNLSYFELHKATENYLIYVAKDDMFKQIYTKIGVKV